MTTLFWNSFLAFCAGVLLNFTPCVLPVIPFKIQAVLHEIRGNIRSRLLAAVSLLSGSLVFFSILGGATAYLGLTWGALFQYRAFLAVLSAFLLFSAVATLADWTFRLPQIFYRVPIHRYMGAFLTGALAGILSTPCSGPFLGAVLGYAVTQTPVIILVIFVSIGVGLAFPYALVLLWPGLLSRFSYARPWAVQIKHILGFVLLAGAIFFGRVFIPEFYHSVLWWIFYAAVTIWALFMLKRSKGWPERLPPVSTIAAVLLLVGLNVSTLPASQIEWKEFTRGSLENTLSERRPVLLEFTADWCLNCKVLEKTAYADKKVVQAVEQVNLLAYRVDMTDFDENKKELLEKYGGNALPYALLMDGNGKVIRRFSGIFSAKTLVGAIYRLEVDRGT